jgi:hypothetical protein
MVYYSTLKKKEILQSVTTLVKCEAITLSKISQSPKHIYTVILFIYRVSKTVKFIQLKVGRENEELLTTGIRLKSSKTNKN